MLLEQIKLDSLTARKNKDQVKSNLLVTLYSEAANIGKTNGNRLTTDQEVIALIKKFIKNNEETSQAISSKNENDTRLQILSLEKDILGSYLPQQLTENEIKNQINEWSNEGITQLGQLMKKFKEQYEGQYDGSMVSKLIKEMMSNT